VQVQRELPTPTTITPTCKTNANRVFFTDYRSASTSHMGHPREEGIIPFDKGKRANPRGSASIQR